MKEGHTYCDCDIVAAEPSILPLDTKDNQSLLLLVLECSKLALFSSATFRSRGKKLYL